MHKRAARAKRTTLPNLASNSSRELQRDEPQWDGIMGMFHGFLPKPATLIEGAGPIRDILNQYCGQHTLQLLEIACGTGRTALALAHAGHDVTAVDRSSTALDCIRAQAEQQGVGVHLAVDDMRVLRNPCDGAFDAALLLGNSVGSLQSISEITNCFEAIHRKLKPGGVFVLGTRDYERILAEHRLSDGPIFADRQRRKQIFFQAWEWLPDGRHYIAHFHVREKVGDVWRFNNFLVNMHAVLIEELAGSLAAAGFANTECLRQAPSVGFQGGTGCDECLLVSVKRGNYQ